MPDRYPYVQAVGFRGANLDEESMPSGFTTSGAVSYLSENLNPEIEAVVRMNRTSPDGRFGARRTWRVGSPRKPAMRTVK